jgi:WD40 repeat protein
MQGCTPNRTRHTLAVTRILDSDNSHLVAIPCANSCFIYGLSADNNFASPNNNTTFQHLFRVAPAEGLVTCSGVMFKPSEEPILAITTVPVDGIAKVINLGLVQIKHNPISPNKFVVRTLANIPITLPSKILGNIDSANTMAFHPLQHNSIVVCPQVANGICCDIVWNEIGEYKVNNFFAGGHFPVTQILFSPTGDMLLTADTNHVVRVFSVQSSILSDKSGLQNANINYMHMLAPYSPSSGCITCMEWYVDVNGKDQIVAGHAGGSISIWSGAEKKQMIGERDEELIMYGMLTEYPSLHGHNSNHAKLIQLQVQRDDYWRTISRNGLVRTWKLRKKKEEKTAKSKKVALLEKDFTQSSLIMTPTTSNSLNDHSRIINCCKLKYGQSTPTTIKLKKKAKNIPFGRSSKTFRDPRAEEVYISEKVTRHRFSSNHFEEHSRVKEMLHHLPPFPLPTTRDILKTDTIKLNKTDFSTGKYLLGCLSLGNSYVDQYIVLTELGLSVVLCKHPSKTKKEMHFNNVIRPKEDEFGPDIRLMLHANKQQLKAWESPLQIGQRAHLRFRLPPSPSCTTIRKKPKPRKKKNQQFNNKSFNEKIYNLNTKLSTLESDLTQVRDTFTSFASHMQRDLATALTIVNQLQKEQVS